MLGQNIKDKIETKIQRPKGGKGEDDLTIK